MMGDLGPAKPGRSLVPHKAENSNIEGEGMEQNSVWSTWYSQNLPCQFQNSKIGELQQMWVFGLQSLY